MEECITVELGHMIEELVKNGEEPIDLRNLLIQSVSNVATKIIFGSRFDYTAEQLENLQFEEFIVKTRKVQRFPFLQVWTSGCKGSEMFTPLQLLLFVLPVLEAAWRPDRLFCCQEEG